MRDWMVLRPLQRLATARVYALAFALVAACADPSSAPTPAAPSPVARSSGVPTSSSGAADTSARVCAALAPGDDVELRGVGVSEAALADVPVVVEAIGALFEALARGDTSLRRTDEPDTRSEDLVEALVASVGRGGLCPVHLRSLRYEHRAAHRVLAAVEMADEEGSLGTVELELWRRDGTWLVSLGRLGRDARALADLRRASAALPQLREVAERWSSGLGWWVSRTIASGTAHCLDADGPGGRVARCFAGARERRPQVGAWDDWVSLRWPPRDCFQVPWPSGTPRRARCDRDDEGRPTDALVEVPAPTAVATLGDVGIERGEDGLTLLRAGRFVEACLLRDGRVACSGPIESREDVELGAVGVSSTLTASGSGWAAIAFRRDEMPGAEMAAGDRVLAVFRAEPDRLVLHGVIPLANWLSERTGHDPFIPRTEWRDEVTSHASYSIDETGCVTIGAAESTSTVRVNRRVTRTGPSDPAPTASDRIDGHFPDTEYERVDTAGFWLPEGAHSFRRRDACPAD